MPFDRLVLEITLTLRQPPASRITYNLALASRIAFEPFDNTYLPLGLPGILSYYLRSDSRPRSSLSHGEFHSEGWQRPPGQWTLQRLHYRVQRLSIQSSQSHAGRQVGIFRLMHKCRLHGTCFYRSAVFH